MSILRLMVAIRCTDIWPWNQKWLIPSFSSKSLWPRDHGWLLTQGNLFAFEKLHYFFWLECKWVESCLMSVHQSSRFEEGKLIIFIRNKVGCLDKKTRPFLTSHMLEYIRSVSDCVHVFCTMLPKRHFMWIIQQSIDWCATIQLNVFIYWGERNQPEWCPFVCRSWAGRLNRRHARGSGSN